MLLARSLPLTRKHFARYATLRFARDPIYHKTTKKKLKDKLKRNKLRKTNKKKAGIKPALHLGEVVKNE